MKDEQFDLDPDRPAVRRPGLRADRRRSSPSGSACRTRRSSWKCRSTAAALRVKRELEGGWFQWVAMPLPAVLTIQSGINQLRYATLKGIMAAKKKEIRKVGGAGRRSRREQKIVSLYVPEKGKKTQMIGGSPAEAAKELVRQLREEARVICMILVIAEQRGGKLNRATWETIAAAQQLAGAQATDRSPSLVPGAERRRRRRGTGRRARCRKSSPSTIAALEPYTPDGYTAALQDAIAQLSPSHVLLPHTYQTRDFAPKLAARLDRALVTDVTGDQARRRPSRRSCGRCSRAS